MLSAERLRNSWSGLEFLRVLLRCRNTELELYCAAEAYTVLPAAGSRLFARVYVTCLCEAGVIS